MQKALSFGGEKVEFRENAFNSNRKKLYFTNKKKKTLTERLKRITPLLRNYCEGFVDRQYIFVPLLMHFFDNL
jgi:hypothetical protein